MRRTLLAVVTLTLVTTGSALASDGARLLDDAFAKALKANDAAAAASFFAKDAVLYPPDAPAAEGRDAIRAYYAALLAKYTVQEFTFTDTHYYSVGTVSTGWGSWTMTLAPKSGGAMVTTRGRFTDVARAEKEADGKWVWFYAVTHRSVRPPAAP
jgi:uncharacterized protein (TIGR02246 family)